MGEPILTHFPFFPLCFHSYSLWSKRSGIVEIKSQKHGCSIGASTPNPPIKAPEARSPFPDFFYRGLYNIHAITGPIPLNPLLFPYHGYFSYSPGTLAHHSIHLPPPFLESLPLFFLFFCSASTVFFLYPVGTYHKSGDTDIK